jgi:RNA recognition motif. (a.k.a. RRM, RBD, or RNP domain)
MNTILEIQKINERELELGLAGTAASWHVTYGTSAWIYVGNVAFELTEGDLICVLSQYGEVDDFWLVRNDETGISRGYGYAKYEDARSCVLAVDNLIGIPVRTVAVVVSMFHYLCETASLTSPPTTDSLTIVLLCLPGGRLLPVLLWTLYQYQTHTGTLAVWSTTAH